MFFRPGWKNVARIATAIPKAPTQVPFLACAGLDRKRSATMKLTIATM